MSFQYRAGNRSLSKTTLDIDALIDATNKGLITSLKPAGRKERRRAARRNLGNASLIAPLLLAEGCLNLGKREMPLAPDEGDQGSSGGSVTPPVASVMAAEDDSGFHTDAGAPLQISATELLANDVSPKGGALELVRVFGAVHGSVSLNNGVVTFTPDAGYEGIATFQYEARDADGNISQASVELHVGDGDHTHDDDGMSDGGDHMHGGEEEDHSHVHPDDPAKANEHIALLSLVPIADATHIAVNNGSWFDPNTWANGEVPGEGAKVFIPEGVSVDYDGESAVSLFTVRVDGELEFATNVNTFMEVDTLIVAPTGHMTMGTIDNPVAANVQAVIQIADNGPIDVAWDPLLLSRGVISHGNFEVHGAEKETFLKVAVDPMAGDTSITLDAPPDGWQVGDRLVLTGTHLVPTTGGPAGTPRVSDTEDEELVITSISGNTIHFNKPLEFNHEGARADLKAYVANYSRNVRFETENADSVPVHQRGHVMLMHSDNIDVRYAEFYELGRTDKSERAFDVTSLDHVDADSNIKARYSLHIHRAGVTDQDDPAMVVGNAVWGSPGWGYVHHDSNAVFADNASYDVFGAGFVAETGNEIGRWTHNISIKSVGVVGGPKHLEDVEAFDLGRTGAGFWFQGRMVAAVDNVAAGHPGGEGFVYMTRGNGMFNVLTENFDQPEALRYLDTVNTSKPAIVTFNGNESIAAGSGLVVIKGGPEQGHDVRSVIEDFTAWEVRYGVHLQYTGHYTLKDIDVVGTSGEGGANRSSIGIEVGVDTFDLVFNGVNVDNFQTGYRFLKEVVNLNHPFDGNFHYVVIDSEVTNTDTPYLNSDAGDLFLTSGDLVEGRLTFDPFITAFSPAPKNPAEGSIIIDGEKVDSIGAINLSPTWDPHYYDWFSLRGAVEQEGYWTLPDGRHVTIFDQYIADRATGELMKTGVFLQNLDTWNLNDSGGFTRITPEYHGVLDPTSAAPVAGDDFANVGRNGSVIIDVLANDFDPEGDAIDIDGLVQPLHGRVFENDDSTLTYVPDPNYTGDDEFWYWVEDDNGNFTKANVQVTVDI